MHRRFAIALSLLLLGLGARQAITGSPAGAVLLERYVWQEAGDWFGGFSGIEVTADGTRMYAISDSGLLLDAKISRDGDQITGISHKPPVTLRQRRPVDLTGPNRDAEGLALMPDGSLCISFEDTAQIGCYDWPGTRARVIPHQGEFDRLHENRSLESLAVDRRANLWTVPESSVGTEPGFAAYRWDGTRWSVPFVIPRQGGFVPVGADFGPEGRFYLLERAASLFGFRTRVRSWRMQRGRLTDPQVHLETGYLRHDNLEGLSVWKDRGGRIRLTMISDDNYFFLQKTEIVEYALPGPMSVTN